MDIAQAIVTSCRFLVRVDGNYHRPKTPMETANLLATYAGRKASWRRKGFRYHGGRFAIVIR